jgi:aryl-alcohol dehydrogenase-like predicted oxidoreductase
MEQVRLGRIGVEVPRASLGTWGHSGPKTVGRQPVGWSGHDDDQATAALLRAHELGITHWDTADVYGDGLAEKLIGSLWDRVERSDIFLASKVGWEKGPYPQFYHPEQIRGQLERSLTLLQTDCIDLYYLHHCDFGPHDETLDDAIELLQRFRSQGKIRFIGLSDWKSSRVVRYADRVDPDVVQVYRNILDDDYEASGLSRWVEAHDVGVVFFSPLKHGLLLGRYETPQSFEAGDHRNRVPGFRDEAVLAQLRRCRQRVEERFAAHPEPVLHALVDSLLSDAPSACVLVGMRRPGHVEAAAALGSPLAADDVAWVRDLYRG